jgi:hypothetical protein
MSLWIIHLIGSTVLSVVAGILLQLQKNMENFCGIVIRLLVASKVQKM